MQAPFCDSCRCKISQIAKSSLTHFWSSPYRAIFVCGAAEQIVLDSKLRENVQRPLDICNVFPFKQPSLRSVFILYSTGSPVQWKYLLLHRALRYGRCRNVSAIWHTIVWRIIIDNTEETQDGACYWIAAVSIFSNVCMRASLTWQWHFICRSPASISVPTIALQ